MSSALVKRFASPFQRLYRMLVLKGKTTTRTTYMTVSPVLSSPQPAPKVRSEHFALSQQIPYFARSWLTRIFSRYLYTGHQYRAHLNR